MASWQGAVEQMSDHIVHISMPKIIFAGESDFYGIQEDYKGLDAAYSDGGRSIRLSHI